MESLAELQKICQSTAQRDRSNVYMRVICRPLSIRLTRFLLPTPATANQVSLAMIVTGVLATLFFMSASKAVFLFGALVLQLWYLLDCMDGEVARYRFYQKTGSTIRDKKEAGLSGMYYDGINHYMIHFLVPMMLGLGLFYQRANGFFLFLGIVGALGQVLMLAMHDVKSKTILNHLRHFPAIEPVSAPPAEAVKPEKGWLHRSFTVLHYSMTYPTVMNLVLVTAVLEFALPGLSSRSIFLSALAFGTAAVTSVLIARTILKQLPEEEVRTQFRIVE